jgi:hypothetical protein
MPNGVFARQSDGNDTASPSEARKSGVLRRSSITPFCFSTGVALNPEENNTRLAESQSLNNNVEALFISGSFFSLSNILCRRCVVLRRNTIFAMMEYYIRYDGIRKSLKKTENSA